MFKHDKDGFTFHVSAATPEGVLRIVDHDTETHFTYESNGEVIARAKMVRRPNGGLIIDLT